MKRTSQRLTHYQAQMRRLDVGQAASWVAIGCFIVGAFGYAPALLAGLVIVLGAILIFKDVKRRDRKFEREDSQ